MLSKIYGYLIGKGRIGEKLATALIMFVYLERTLLAVALGLFLGYWAAYPFFGGRYKGDGAIVGLLLFLYRFFFLGKKWPLKFLSLEGMIDSLIVDPDDDVKYKTDRFGKLPHFGKGLKKHQVMDIIDKSSFLPYQTKDGTILENITVSEDEKWLCICGGYMPLDLMCGYNDEANVLYSIDGGVIKLPGTAKLKKISHEINAFFEDRGMHYYTRPWKADEKFEEVLGKPYSELGKADFSRLRYQWEKNNANDLVSRIHNDIKWEDYEPVSAKGEVGHAIFERVLSDMEISSTMLAVISRKADLSAYLRFEDYENEFAVCNGIELLGRMEKKDNPKAIKFLFDCLSDVDEAYFVPAVDLLCKYKKRTIRENIEKEIRHAFENKDVVRIGGIMYLADRMDYKIQYFEEMKNTENVEVQKALEVAGMP